ncbi:hypothetical protein GCM10009720_26560 [Yaniella flava]|uniref:Uncharacterized protein n=1 Tax=Yaniella flava TaxID=287930 RepID=A0ABP5GD74_9MICC
MPEAAPVIITVLSVKSNALVTITPCCAWARHMVLAGDRGRRPPVPVYNIALENPRGVGPNGE